MILGAGMILYSLVTDYELGMIHALPMSAHLMIDILAGLVLAVSPWLLGFSGTVWVPHVVFGILEIGAALVTQVVPSYERLGRRSRV